MTARIRRHALVMPLAVVVLGVTVSAHGRIKATSANLQDRVDACLADAKSTDPLVLEAFLSAVETSPFVATVDETPVPLGSKVVARDKAAARDRTGSDALVSWNPQASSALVDCMFEDPCATLLHELSHVFEIGRGVLDDSDKSRVGGISATERNAIDVENVYRRAKGLCLRSRYEGIPVDPRVPECAACTTTTTSTTSTTLPRRLNCCVCNICVGPCWFETCACVAANPCLPPDLCALTSCSAFGTLRSCLLATTTPVNVACGQECHHKCPGDFTPTIANGPEWCEVMSAQLPSCP